MSDVHSRFAVRIETAGSEVPLRVVSMRGYERLSSPFEFVVHVETEDDVPLIFSDFDALMAGQVTLSFGEDLEHPIHGVVRRIRTTPVGGAEVGTYELTIVPRFAGLELTRGSWIYQDKTPAEIITAAFELGGEEALVEGEDFELSLEGTIAPREYVVQYEESVLHFIQRQAEHWGYWYLFDHLGDAEKVLIADTNNAFPRLEGFEEIAFESRVGVVAVEAIRQIGATIETVESEVSLREYNYRIPSVELVTPAQPVDADFGVGSVHVTGDHFWNPDEGTGLARLRAEEMMTRRRRMQAVSNVRGLRAGHRFTLTGAEPEAHGLGGEYIVVGVRHSFSADGDHGGDMPYYNELDLLPAAATYRPPRVTVKPRIYGVMHAKVDAEAEDEINVPVDEWGRYKVVMPFDVAGETGGKSSCWIRLANPAGGAGWGFAQGLHNKTEVAIYHIDGDPDRPVIAGAVTNFEQPSTVRRENAQQSVIASRQGITITLSDA